MSEVGKVLVERVRLLRATANHEKAERGEVETNENLIHYATNFLIEMVRPTPPTSPLKSLLF